MSSETAATLGEFRGQLRSTAHIRRVGVTVTEHAQDEDTETEATKRDSAMINVIMYTYCDTAKCPLCKKADKLKC